MDERSRAAFSPLAARIFGAATILAPLLLLGADVAYVTEGSGINEGVLGGTIGVWSCFMLLLAAVGILRLLEVRAPRAAPIISLFAFTGFGAGVAINVNAIFVAAVGPEANAAIDAGFDEQPIAILAFLPWAWFGPLSIVLMGVFLWSTRTTAWWTGALLIAGGVLFLVSRPFGNEGLMLVTGGVLVAAFVPIGWMLSSRASGSSSAGPALPKSERRQPAAT